MFTDRTHENTVARDIRAFLEKSTRFNPADHDDLVRLALLSGLPLDQGKVGTPNNRLHVSARTFQAFADAMAKNPRFAKAEKAKGKSPTERLAEHYRSIYSPPRF